MVEERRMIRKRHKDRQRPFDGDAALEERLAPPTRSRNAGCGATGI
jgi:hypothetical protein